MKMHKRNFTWDVSEEWNNKNFLVYIIKDVFENVHKILSTLKVLWFEGLLTYFF